jgi:hypothetical protein
VRLQNGTHRIQGRSVFISLYAVNTEFGVMYPGPDTGATWTATITMPITPLVIGGTLVDFCSLFRQYKVHTMTFRLVPAGWWGYGPETGGAGSIQGATVPIVWCMNRDPDDWLTTGLTFAQLAANGGWIGPLTKPSTRVIRNSPWLFSSPSSTISINGGTSAMADYLRLCSPGAMSMRSNQAFTATSGSSTNPQAYIICDWDCSFRRAQEFLAPIGGIETLGIRALCREDRLKKLCTPSEPDSPFEELKQPAPITKSAVTTKKR